jgi:hypothetical protein
VPTTQLIGDASETGVDLNDLLDNNPGAIQEVKFDTLRYLMEDGHPIESIDPGEGHSIGRHRRVV